MLEARDLLNELTKKGMKVTPQRVAVFSALNKMRHPTAEAIYKNVSAELPGLSYTTVYNILGALANKGLINKVKTDAGVMRYDAINDPHHHLYCIDTDRMEDYFDADLDHILMEYFKKKNLPNFQITDIRLQIMGEFEQKETNIK